MVVLLGWVRDGLPAVGGALKVIAQVDLLLCAKYVVHDAKVAIVTRLVLLLVKDYFVNPQNFGDHRVWVYRCQKLMVVLQNALHELELCARDSFQNESLVLSVVEKAP